MKLLEEYLPLKKGALKLLELIVKVMKLLKTFYKKGMCLDSFRSQIALKMNMRW